MSVLAGALCILFFGTGGFFFAFSLAHDSDDFMERSRHNGSTIKSKRHALTLTLTCFIFVLVGIFLMYVKTGRVVLALSLLFLSLSLGIWLKNKVFAVAQGHNASANLSADENDAELDSQEIQSNSLAFISKPYTPPHNPQPSGLLGLNEFSEVVAKHLAICFTGAEPPNHDSYWRHATQVNTYQSLFLGQLQQVVEMCQRTPLSNRDRTLMLSLYNSMDYGFINKTAQETISMFIDMVWREVDDVAARGSSTLTQTKSEIEAEQAHQFLRDATMHHDNKDFDAAIECLRSAYSLLKPSFSNYPMSVWVRLPLYLQKAGQFNEAMHGFGLLIEKINERKRPSYLSDVQHNAQNATDLAFVFDKIRLTAQREKQFDIMAYYGLNAYALDWMSRIIRGDKEATQVPESDNEDNNAWLDLLKKYEKSKSLQKNKDKVLTACLEFDSHQDCNQFQADTLVLLGAA